MKTYTGKQLQFISQIKRDGSGVIDVTKEDFSYKDDIDFELHPLSITEKTFIACEFTIYVVKIK